MIGEVDLAAFDPGLLAWPLAAGLLVLATHVPLGRRVLARGIIFLDLAIAQIAVLGVIAAHSHSTWPQKPGAPRSPPRRQRWRAPCCSLPASGAGRISRKR
jgi:hypothetical protein